MLAPCNAAAASSESGFFHCCKDTASGTDYCCIFSWSCFADGHCEE